MVVAGEVEHARAFHIERDIEVVGGLIKEVAGVGPLIAAAAVVSAPHIRPSADPLIRPALPLPQRIKSDRNHRRLFGEAIFSRWLPDGRLLPRHVLSSRGCSGAEKKSTQYYSEVHDDYFTNSLTDAARLMYWSAQYKTLQAGMPAAHHFLIRRNRAAAGRVMGQGMKIGMDRDASKVELRAAGRSELARCRLVDRRQWAGGSGNWSQPSNWSNGVPTATSDVTINTASAATITIQAGEADTVHSLTIGGNDSLSMPGGGDPANPTANSITNNSGFESPTASNSTTRATGWGSWGSSYLSTAIRFFRLRNRWWSADRIRE